MAFSLALTRAASASLSEAASFAAIVATFSGVCCAWRAAVLTSPALGSGSRELPVRLGERLGLMGDWEMAPPPLRFALSVELPFSLLLAVARPLASLGDGASLGDWERSVASLVLVSPLEVVGRELLPTISLSLPGVPGPLAVE